MLPPVIDNAWRADHARAALATFVSNTRVGSDALQSISVEGTRETIEDLICDLLHEARRLGVDPVVSLDRALMHFRAEEGHDEAVVDQPNLAGYARQLIAIALHLNGTTITDEDVLVEVVLRHSGALKRIARRLRDYLHPQSTVRAA